MGNGRTAASNARNISAVGRLRNRPTGLTSRVRRAAAVADRRGERLSAALGRQRGGVAAAQAALGRAQGNRRRARNR